MTTTSSLGQDSSSTSEKPSLLSSSSSRTSNPLPPSVGSTKSAIASSSPALSRSLSPSSCNNNNNNNGDDEIVTTTRSVIPNDNDTSKSNPSQSPKMTPPPPRTTTVKTTTKSNSTNNADHLSITNNRMVPPKSLVTQTKDAGTQRTNTSTPAPNVNDHCAKSSSSSQLAKSSASSLSFPSMLGNHRPAADTNGSRKQPMEMSGTSKKFNSDLGPKRAPKHPIKRHLNHHPSRTRGNNEGHATMDQQYNNLYDENFRLRNDTNHCLQRGSNVTSSIALDDNSSRTSFHHPGQFHNVHHDPQLQEQHQQFSIMEDSRMYPTMDHHFRSDSSIVPRSSPFRNNSARQSSSVRQLQQSQIESTSNFSTPLSFNPEFTAAEWNNQDIQYNMSRVAKEYETLVSSNNGGTASGGVNLPTVSKGTLLSSSDSMLLSTIRRRRLLQLRQLIYYRKRMFSSSFPSYPTSYMFASSYNMNGDSRGRSGGGGGLGRSTGMFRGQTNQEHHGTLEQQLQQEQQVQYLQQRSALNKEISHPHHNPAEEADMNEIVDTNGTAIIGTDYNIPMGTCVMNTTTAIKNGIDPLLGFLPQRDNTITDPSFDGFHVPFYNKCEYDQDYATAMEVVQEMEEQQNEQWYLSSFGPQSIRNTPEPQAHPGSNPLVHSTANIGSRIPSTNQRQILAPPKTNPKLLSKKGDTEKDRFMAQISSPPPSPVQAKRQQDDEKPLYRQAQLQRATGKNDVNTNENKSLHQNESTSSSPPRLHRTTTTKVTPKNKKMTNSEMRRKASKKLNSRKLVTPTILQTSHHDADQTKDIKTKQEDISKPGNAMNDQIEPTEQDQGKPKVPTSDKQINGRRRRQKQRQRPTFRELRHVSMMETQETLRLARLQLNDHQREKLESLLLVDPNDTEEALKHIIIPPVLWSDIRTSASTNTILTKPHITSPPSLSVPPSFTRILPLATSKPLSLKGSVFASLPVSPSNIDVTNEPILVDNGCKINGTEQSKVSGGEGLLVKSSAKLMIGSVGDTKSSISSAVVVPLSPPNRRPEITTSSPEFPINKRNFIASDPMDLGTRDSDHSHPLTEEPELVHLLSANGKTKDPNTNDSLIAVVDQSKLATSATKQTTPANRHSGSVVVTPISCVTITEPLPKHQFQPIENTEIFPCEDDSSSKKSKRNSDDVQIESIGKSENMVENEDIDSNRIDDVWKRSPKRYKTLEPQQLFHSTVHRQAKVTVLSPPPSPSVPVIEDCGHPSKHIENYEDTSNRDFQRNRKETFGKVQETNSSMLDGTFDMTNCPKDSFGRTDSTAWKAPRRHSVVIRNLFGQNQTARKNDIMARLKCLNWPDDGEEETEGLSTKQKTNRMKGVDILGEALPGPINLTRSISQTKQRTPSPTLVEENPNDKSPKQREKIENKIGSNCDPVQKRSEQSRSSLLREDGLSEQYPEQYDGDGNSGDDNTGSKIHSTVVHV